MKAALVTPSLGHLPLHPGSYLGYGTSILRERYDLDVFDFNAEVCVADHEGFQAVLSRMEESQVVLDALHLHPYVSRQMKRLPEVAGHVDWENYPRIFIAPPSWFVTVPTEKVLRLAALLSGRSPESSIFFFGNSLGSWTDEKVLKENGIRILHLNDLQDPHPVNKPVNFDALPTPEYKAGDPYLFHVIPFRLKHGCGWGKCRFCSLAAGWNSGYLERDPGKVILEMEELVDRYDPAMLVCRDNSVNGSNLLACCAGLRRFDRPWAASARADLTEAEMQSLRRAGCRMIYFGLESGSDRVLRAINKGIDTKHMSRFIRGLCEQDIVPVPSLFVGSPGERESDFQDTVRFVLDHSRYIEILNLYPFLVTPASDFSGTDQTADKGVTLLRLHGMIRACAEAGIKVCVGEQSAEYAACRKIYGRPEVFGPGGRTGGGSS